MAKRLGSKNYLGLRQDKRKAVIRKAGGWFSLERLIWSDSNKAWMQYPFIKYRTKAMATKAKREYLGK